MKISYSTRKTLFTGDIFPPASLWPTYPTFPPIPTHGLRRLTGSTSPLASRPRSLMRTKSQQSTLLFLMSSISPHVTALFSKPTYYFFTQTLIPPTDLFLSLRLQQTAFQKLPRTSVSIFSCAPLNTFQLVCVLPTAPKPASSVTCLLVHKSNGGFSVLSSLDGSAVLGTAFPLSLRNVLPFSFQDISLACFSFSVF